MTQGMAPVGEALLSRSFGEGQEPFFSTFQNTGTGAVR